MSSYLCLCPQRSADRVHDDTATVLSELQRSVERLQELVEGVMNQAGQEKVSEAQDVVDKLEAEISELKRRDKDMKEVFRCEDNIHFLEVGRFSLSVTLLYIFDSI